MTKPFDPKELLACVRALTRRQPELRDPEALEFGGVRLDKGSFTLSCLVLHLDGALADAQGSATRAGTPRTFSPPPGSPPYSHS